jgi:hypothetical protein
MLYFRIAILMTVFLAGAFAGKKNPDDVTQVLELPKDPPMVASGETSRLVFNVSPLSGKGLLSQQTRDALKALLKANGGAQVIHLRAFVAGSGDMRRVPQIVSQVFTAKKMPLPSVSVVLAGALPLEDAQIEIESISVGKRDVNPDGLTFIEAKTPDRIESTALAVTCFVSSFAGTSAIAARFASAAVDIVQTQRTPSRTDTSCEAVERGGNVKAPRLAFTGTQVAFGSDEKAAELAFQRLDRDLGSAEILQTRVYALSERLGDLARKVRAGSITVIPFEGVASLDGAFAVDAVAAVTR